MAKGSGWVRRGWGYLIAVSGGVPCRVVAWEGIRGAVSAGIVYGAGIAYNRLCGKG